MEKAVIGRPKSQTKLEKHQSHKPSSSLLFGLKEGFMPNFRFLDCLKVEVLWLETTTKRQKTRQDNLVELEATLA
jgi:hypothetical protein